MDLWSFLEMFPTPLDQEQARKIFIFSPLLRKAKASQGHSTHLYLLEDWLVEMPVSVA